MFSEAKTKSIKIIVVAPHEKPYTKLVPNELEDLQKIVKGYIEAVPLNDDYILICNEEGLIHNLEHNRNINTHPIRGTFFIVRASITTGDFISIEDEKEEELLKIFSGRNIFID